MPEAALKSQKFAVIAPAVIRVTLVAAITWLIMQHVHGGTKGLPIPVFHVFLSMLSAFVAAVMCKRYWLSFAVPFVASIAGAYGIAGPLYGPYGDVLGFLVGGLVLTLPLWSSRACKESSD